MTKQRQENESFVRQLIVKVEAAVLEGITTPQAIADHFNTNGVTSHKGKRWTSTTVVKLLNSPSIERSFLNGEMEKTGKVWGDHDKMSIALNNARLQRISESTIGHYDRLAEDFWQGTQNHDVSQNYEAFLEAIEESPPCAILDLGCGPGRDLHFFQSLGHTVTGLDGSKEFVAMARAHSSCEVLHQDFLAMTLPESHFNGVFANASLFHVPSSELPRILLDLFLTLKPRGVLLCSNPRGNNDEGLSDERYSCFFNPSTWCEYVTGAGFTEVQRYFRPPGLPRHRQPWLVTVWRKG
jgi:SAM-dependent methyltransferase